MRTRNTLPLLSRAPQPAPSRSNSPGPSSSYEVYTATPPTQLPRPLIPAIRLVEATPSPDSTADQVSPAVLAPREHPSPRKKLVPKKSKLALLTSRASSSVKSREKDLSDVVRRVGDRWGMDEDGACNVTVNGGNAHGKGRKSSRSTIDIYVDPADDPDIGEIVVVKKKKSRAGLDGIRWALGEVSNNAEAGAGTKPKEEGDKVKLKVDEKEKWWSIGRGRRDSKENKDAAKGKLRAKAPSASAVPTLSTTQANPPSTLTRNRSLDSGLLLCVPAATTVSPSTTLSGTLPPTRTPASTPFLTVSGAPPPPPKDEHVQDYFSAQPSAQPYYAEQGQGQGRPRFGSTPGLLCPPDSGYSSAGFNVPEDRGGSLAVRAMRSVKSLARIGSWAQLKNTPAPAPEPTSTAAGKKKKSKKPEKLDDTKRVKSSSSSWEVGALSAAGDDTTHSRYGTMAALGNGYPSAYAGGASTRRDSAGTLLSVGTGSSYRTSSSSSSGLSAPAVGNRLSVSSAEGSTYTASGEDTGGFGAGVPQLRRRQGSVKWGDVVVGGGIGGEREMRVEDERRDPKDSKRDSKSSKDSKVSKREKKEKKAKEKEKRNSARSSMEARRRTPVTSVFPGLVVQAPSPESVEAAHRDILPEQAQVQVAVRVPIPPFQPVFPSQARVRGEQGQQEGSPVPPARPRPRPVSEQLLGSSRPRPRGIVGEYDGEDAAGALSVLEAANSDLASLINRLDLEATPDSKASRPVSFAPTDPTTSSRFTLGEPDSPSARRGGFDDSPLKKTAGARASITSLRPYNQSRAKMDMSTIRAGGSNVAITIGRATVPEVPPVPTFVGQPIIPWANLVPKEEDRAPEVPAKTHQPTFPTLRARQNKFILSSPTLEEDSLPALQPLQPPKHQHPPRESRIRTSSSELRARAAPFIRTASVSSTFAAPNKGSNTPSQNEPVEPSSHTFGGLRTARYTLPQLESGSSSPRSVITVGTPTPSPHHGHARKGSTIVPFVKRAVESIEANQRRQSIQEAPTKRRSAEAKVKAQTMGASARRDLGFKGTMGVDENGEAEPNDEDEDSDIPDELQVILSSQSDDTSKMGDAPMDAVDDTLSFVPAAPSVSLSTSMSSRLPPSPGLPPAVPLPTPSSTPGVLSMPSLEPSPPAPTFLLFLDPSPSPTAAPTVAVHAVSDDGENEGDIDEPNNASSGSEDDTKQSFDFTGELQRLNESGGAHRRSFVEQLENAFKTPSKLGAEDLGFEIDGFLGASLGGPNGSKPDQGMTMEDMSGTGSEEAKQDVSMMVDSVEVPSNLLKPMPSVTSRPSYGRLDTAFKFGGKPQPQADVSTFDNSVARELPGVAALSTSPSPEQPSALPRRHSRASSTSMIEEDSSVLRSIYAQAAQNFDLAGHRAQPSLSLESDTSSKRHARQSHVPAHARSSSDVSFSGMSSFGAVRTKFEFGPERPAFFSPSYQASQAPTSHGRQESMFSIASVSSYGEVINSGSQDPFDYATLGQDASADRDGLASIDETMLSFEESRRRKRFSTDSDMSSFYYRAPSQPHVTQQRREHGRNQSVISTNSMNGPPISLYNRSFGHKRSDSAGSANSIANAYGVHGASGGRAAWVKHKQDRSIDSVMSGFSAVRLGRPGVGDKMFESAADHGPLTSISASPPESVAGDLAQKSSYDSILDDDQRSTVDSIFDHTGQRSSVSSDSVFGYDTSDPARGNLFPPTHFRPLSIISIGNPGTPREDDTMISMLGGGHVRRKSIGSSFSASPCFRVEKREKRKHSDFAHQPGPFGYENGSPNKARLIHRESVASSTSSKSKFGESRMTLAQRGLLQRSSLEDSCLSGEGEEDFTMHSIRSPVFTRPTPSSRPRTRPVVTISQPPDTTPPLSSSEGSQSGESQSSIDIARLKVLLQTASAGSRSSTSRARARGHGHRRRVSQVSRASAIGTIQEENPGLSNSPSPGRRSNRDSLDSVSSLPPSPRDPIPTAEPSVDIVEWDDERVVIGLRKYYALRSEADETISHSKMVWPDTPFSLHALQTFTPPNHPAGMQALLEHSQKSYITLPSELRPRRIRSRTSSINRPSPYPRTVNRSLSPSSTHSRRSSTDMSSSMSISSSFDRSRALQPVSTSQNLTSPIPALAALTPFSPLVVDLSRSEEKIPVPQSVIKPTVRPRVGSAARRNALGWTKRRTPKTGEGKSAHANKENEAHGLLTSPTESLRIVRPRPRGRIVPPVPPTPRSTSLLA